MAPAQPQAPLNASAFHEWTFPDGRQWAQFFRTEAGYLLRFPDLADFQISRDGTKVTSSPAPDVSDDTIQHLYLNQVQPLALARQGKFVFHASAVEIESGAVAFLGESGRGKSTLAASFATSGFRFLADDGLVVEPDNGGYQVMPSHPSIRLWNDSEQALIGDSVTKAPPLEYTSKARFLASDGIHFCDHPRHLHRVYFLGDGTPQQPVFERLIAADALIELVKHSFLLDIEEREMLAAQFDELSRLVRQPIYYRLDYPRRFEDLAQVRQAIMNHANDEKLAA
jgi:hypothetical protein